MAITKPNLTRIWAATAAGGDVVDPDVQTPGKFSLGWGAEKPPYQFFNFMQKLFTQGLGYFDEQGIAFWNTDTDYQNFSITKGSNGRLYLLKSSGDGTIDPISDGGTNWTPLPTREEVDAKAPIESPVFTGLPEADTAAIGTSTKQIATTEFVSQALAGIPVTGTAIFTNSTNNIALTGIGSIGLEIGDVVEVTGTSSNNKLFTVEVITDDDNVIVNQAHAGGTTSNSLVNETVSATVDLVVKWFSAPLGLGQGWVLVTGSRSADVLYTNPLPRAIGVGVNIQSNATPVITLEVEGVPVDRMYEQSSFGGSIAANISGQVPGGQTYEVVGTPFNLNFWSELR